MNKPRPLNPMEVARGDLSLWCERYAEWLASKPSFLNATERARFGRIKALRALFSTLRAMLPSAGWTDIQIQQIADDIRATAKLKADSTLP
jgi:hypothetical protein